MKFKIGDVVVLDNNINSGRRGFLTTNKEYVVYEVFGNDIYIEDDDGERDYHNQHYFVLSKRINRNNIINEILE